MNRYVKAESVTLVHSGNNYFDMLGDIIASAKEEIHIQTYIFENDATGKDVIEKLKEAVKRNVKVHVLADAFGSSGLPANVIDDMKYSGINFRLFSPLFSTESIYLGRRLHHKIVVADRIVALVGGINIADKYRGSEKEAAWLDYAVLIKGKGCVYLHDLCEEIYEKKNLRTTQIYPEEGWHMIRFRRNDWIRRKNEIHKSYREALTSAQKSVTIVASYFLPGFFFSRLLKKAIDRGVKVRIIEAGKTDLPFVKLAEKYLYRHLLKSGVEIYEWKNSVMHGKAILVDGKWTTIGSYNLNYLSHYRSIELNVDIKDGIFGNVFSAHLDRIISRDCARVTPDILPVKKGPFFYLKTLFAYYFFKILFSILMPKRRNPAPLIFAIVLQVY